MRRIILFAILVAVVASSCSVEEKTLLFNGQNLTNWSIHLPDSIDEGSVFYVDDEKIHVGGIPNGYIKTNEMYDNYKLHVEWRWIDQPKNSGVLLHATGEDMIWPNCIEAQLMAGKAGDFVLIGKGSGITVNGQEYLVESEENRYLVSDKFEESSENQPGEWNSYDITVTDTNIKLKVNDVLQNEGINPTRTRGHICIQSEGGPMEFRNIYLVKLK
ncbi:MAG: DUF1080 domain-containing protein [Bacteroidales bacterium]|nr:DUF1080 domain-containing protein [Bacteroidales bacterium]